jgi:hypothetical protein
MVKWSQLGPEVIMADPIIWCQAVAWGTFQVMYQVHATGAADSP